jgi:hypothetical protein
MTPAALVMVRPDNGRTAKLGAAGGAQTPSPPMMTSARLILP